MNSGGVYLQVYVKHFFEDRHIIAPPDGSVYESAPLFSIRFGKRGFSLRVGEKRESPNILLHCIPELRTGEVEHPGAPSVYALLNEPEELLESVFWPPASARAATTLSSQASLAGIASAQLVSKCCLSKRPRTCTQGMHSSRSRASSKSRSSAASCFQRTEQPNPRYKFLQTKLKARRSRRVIKWS